jgi:hypothetical protein
LVGRLDAKAHRSRGQFEVKSLHLEPGMRISQRQIRPRTVVLPISTGHVARYPGGDRSVDRSRGTVRSVARIGGLDLTVGPAGKALRGWRSLLVKWPKRAGRARDQSGKALVEHR